MLQLPTLRRFWQLRSLSAKLLLPVTGLMLTSLLGSILAFIAGTALTQNQLLQQQISADTKRISEALKAREEDVATAAGLLANDPNVAMAVAEDSETALGLLNSRAVVVRDRFDLGLIQIYNRQEKARTNLVLSDLYRESSLLDEVKSDEPVVRVVEGKVLLLSQARMPDDAGTVIVGVDLETELNRLISKYRLSADLGLSVNETHVGTRRDLPFDSQEGWDHDHYSQHLSLILGETPIDLLLVRSTADISRVTVTGLVVMIVSTLLTTALLLGLSVLITRSIARPIQQLSVSAEAVASGDLSLQVEIANLTSPFGIGRGDEIGLLAATFNGMIAELRSLYENLEAKVEARTHDLETAAEIAGAVSSSLELDDVLRASTQLIHERLGFYHVAVFLVEPGSEMAVLSGAAGETGRLLEEQNHQLAIGSKSLVGVATATRQPRIVQDVTADPLYFNNPLLPDTRSEAAIPLLAGQTLVGVLDVQSEQIEAFPPDVIELLMALSDQVAIGVHNAQLYARQRQTAEHLAEVDRLKTQFLANMSHELRTPLNAIIGFSKFMLGGLDGPVTELQVQDLTAIHNSGQHLLYLINDILDISKINAGQMKLNIETVDFQDVLRDVMDTASVLIKDKPISIQQELPPELPRFYADKVRLRQIMLNLLSNATKFTDSGEVTICAQMTEAFNPHTESVEPFIKVSVTDTGIGIPKDRLTDIFREFIQVDDSDTRRFGGTGLGLPITKKLIQLHGGQIWAESKVEHGSTFTFILPIHQQEPEAIEIEPGFQKESSRC